MSSLGNKPGGKDDGMSHLMLKNMPNNIKEQLTIKGLWTTKY